MKKLLLILFFCLPVLATQYTWDGGAGVSQQWTNDTNWVGNVKPSAASDTILFTSNTGKNCSLNTNVTVGKIVHSSTDNFNFSSRTINTTAGGIILGNATASYSAAIATVSLDGAGDSLLLGSNGLANATSTLLVTNYNCIVSNGKTNQSFYRISITSGSLTINGSALSLSGVSSATSIVLNNGRLTCNVAVIITSIAASANIFDFTNTDTLNGTGAWTIRPVHGNFGFGSLAAYTGSGAWSISAVTTASYTDTLTSNFNIGGNSLTIGKGSTGKTILNSGGYTITCGAFQTTNSSATDSAFFYLGAGTLNCNSKNVPTSLTGVSVLNLGSGIVNCSGVWTNSSNANAIMTIGTSTVNIDSVSTITSVGKTFYNLIFAAASNRAITTADTLKVANDLTLTSGKAVQNSKPWYIGRDYTNNLTTAGDTTFMSELLYIGRNYYRNAGTYTLRTGGIIQLSDTGTHTVTANSNQIGPFWHKSVTFLDSVKIQRDSTVDSATIKFAASYGVRYDTIADYEGSTGKNIRFIGPGRFWIPKSDTVGFQTDSGLTVSGFTLYFDSTCRTLGSNTGIKSLSYVGVTKDSTSGLVGGHIIFTSAGFVGGGWSINGAAQSLTVTNYKSATGTIPSIASGTYAVKIWNGDADTVAVGNYEVLTGCTAPTISYAALSATYKVAITPQSPTLGGGTCDSVVAISTLPAGLTITKTGATKGQISGTPTAVSAKAGYRIRAYGAALCDSADAYDSITVSDIIPVITSATPAYGKTASAGNTTLIGSWLKYLDTVWFGTAVSTSFGTQTDSTAIVAIPNHTAGAVSLIGRNTAGRDTLAGFVYKNLWITSVTPSSGVAGDTITGHAAYGFGTSGLSATIGDSTAAVVAGYTDTMAKIIVPTMPAGSYRIIYTNTGADTCSVGWTYGAGGNSGATKKRFNFGFGFGF